jgi:hypothetical protein
MKFIFLKILWQDAQAHAFRHKELQRFFNAGQFLTEGD